MYVQLDPIYHHVLIMHILMLINQMHDDILDEMDK